MSRVLPAAGAAALLIHLAIFAFGGLLLPSSSDQEKVRESVDLMGIDDQAAEEEKKKEEETQKEQEAQQTDEAPADEAVEHDEAPPDLTSRANLEAPVEPAALEALSMSDLEGVLNSGPGTDSMAGGFGLASGGRIGGAGSGTVSSELEPAGLDSTFAIADLDRRPRAVFQTSPRYPRELRSRGVDGSVTVAFVVDREGRVTNAKVERSTSPAFERPALEAVKQWTFEPGTRKGEKVQFHLRVPITFKAG
jgi:protein TonB